MQRAASGRDQSSAEQRRVMRSAGSRANLWSTTRLRPPAHQSKHWLEMKNCGCLGSTRSHAPSTMSAVSGQHCPLVKRSARMVGATWLGQIVRRELCVSKDLDGDSQLQPLGRDRNGKKTGEKVSRDNRLRRLMPALLGRFPDHRGRASMMSAIVVGGDRCR